VAKNSEEQSAKPKRSIGKSVFKVVLVVALAAGACYAGTTLFRLRNTNTFTGLVMLQDGGIAIYKYEPPHDEASETKVSDGDSDQLEVSPTMKDWTLVEIGPKAKILDKAGSACSLAHIFAEGTQKKVLEISVGPDGLVSKIREVSDSFSVQGEVEKKETDEVTIDGNTYTIRSGEYFPAGEGDLVRIYGSANEIMFSELLQKAGLLRVSSNVEGARVFVDGSYKGKTPLEFKTASGTKEVTVKADDHKTTKVMVQVEPQVKSEVFVEMPRIAGVLEVTTDPPNSQIYLNADLSGVSPLKLELSPGNYEIVAKHDGYYSKRATVRLIADASESVHFELVKEKERLSPGLGPTPGNTSPGTGTESAQTSTVKIKVLGFTPSSRTLDGVDESGNLRSIEIPSDVSLESGSSTRSSWDTLLPAEEVSLTVSSSGAVLQGVKVYSHTFTQKGTLASKDSQAIVLAEKWAKYEMRPDVLVERRGQKGFSATIDVGDVVTVYGASAEDIRYVQIESSLGEKSVFECHLVNSKDGPIVFGENSIMSFKLQETVNVLDSANRRSDKISQVPSGSRIRFYVSNLGEVVWAEYVWKAEVSLEGQVAVFSGPVLSVSPAWQDLTISHNTVVFSDREKRPFYDIKIGDKVLAAGPSSSDIGFVWIQGRISSESVVEGFIGASSGSKGRVFYKVESRKETIPMIIPADLNFVYPEGRTALSLKDLKWGDKARLWLDSSDKPVWCEIIERNGINSKGHYLGKSGDLLYFSGFLGLKPDKDLTVIGLSGLDEIGEGSLVYVGGHGQTLNYIEVDEIVEPKWWVDGAILSVDKNTMLALTTRYSVVTYTLSGDVPYVDWDSKSDGSVSELGSGDEVKIGIDKEGYAVFVERVASPRFRVGGTVMAVSDRTVTISGDYGTLRVTVDKNAMVFKGGEIGGYSLLAKGDKVTVSGWTANNIDLVVCGQ
jgi:hypothetical protein